MGCEKKKEGKKKDGAWIVGRVMGVVAVDRGSKKLAGGGGGGVLAINGGEGTRKRCGRQRIVGIVAWCERSRSDI